jgi:hypothetical protein
MHCEVHRISVTSQHTRRTAPRLLWAWWGEGVSSLLTVVVERHGADSRRETRGDQVAYVTRPAARGLQVHEPLAPVRPRRTGAGGWGGFAASPCVPTGLGPAAHGGFEGALRLRGNGEVDQEENKRAE